MNQETGLHRVVLTLERIADQRPMEELSKIPRPSQVDDWQLFEKYEGEMIQQKRGEQCFMEWKTAKAQERMEQKQWKRALEVGTALTTARLTRQSVGMKRDTMTKET